jgi:hypothetical protein
MRESAIGYEAPYITLSLLLTMYVLQIMAITAAGTNPTLVWDRPTRSQEEQEESTPPPENPCPNPCANWSPELEDMWKDWNW